MNKVSVRPHDAHAGRACWRAGGRASVRPLACGSAPCAHTSIQFTNVLNMYKHTHTYSYVVSSLCLYVVYALEKFKCFLRAHGASSSLLSSSRLRHRSREPTQHRNTRHTQKHQSTRHTLPKHARVVLSLAFTHAPAYNTRTHTQTQLYHINVFMN